VDYLNVVAPLLPTGSSLVAEDHVRIVGNPLVAIDVNEDNPGMLRTSVAAGTGIPTDQPVVELVEGMMSFGSISDD